MRTSGQRRSSPIRELRAPVDQMLAVVQDQQQPAIAKRLAEGFQRILARPLADPEQAGHRVRY
jgi:hypothetical protein